MALNTISSCTPIKTFIFEGKVNNPLELVFTKGTYNDINNTPSTEGTLMDMTLIVKGSSIDPDLLPAYIIPEFSGLPSGGDKFLLMLKEVSKYFAVYGPIYTREFLETNLVSESCVKLNRMEDIEESYSCMLTVTFQESNIASMNGGIPKIQEVETKKTPQKPTRDGKKREQRQCVQSDESEYEVQISDDDDDKPSIQVPSRENSDEEAPN